MGNLFGRKRRSRVTEQDRAVLVSGGNRDGPGSAAERGYRDGPGRAAMLLLKKKRYQEQLLDKTENQISNLERMVQDIEFTQIEMKVIEGLKIGNECLNKMHQVMSIEEVERIIGETQDAVEYQRQIDELLAGSLTEEDEDAILEELNAITQEQLELPEVPSEPLPEKIPEVSPIKNRPKPELVAAS
ncbi:CHMP6 protein, partial [Cercotrichas coryphoeus]|nr:CHMP6 protein [Cercotrichas coryphoeus]